ncbi:bifunctional diaminohydroxyphosphoribosylaminopyrimidine deaminase/5-amino-6-(5-phosphoribosylamino)uracil reductase RibD [Altererythrobacter arenosus]|uniref:Riboflavin biosynthesis protein RibD n=1 Tax=Altererythrobacter arenosus TaxID=3032592 RepID=A0ABY8FTQ2_9SPHN|nr:bifunctional diaminohydroxyphosphoribosylaminopyrimidine deaminase/5-amino-6-(5-phosphoribosylamino)uracil reductase RibD [Altererythrobacter sp. CAU 1644]WFL78212.1 bifunctional diaminohydroxyphosphoribosylaminopyrimidine deaminase/5-amino-6-(5-phosphoribosylamino)uracil reductase RibD [Altererythrobacter sp. CAU 1644]
MQNAASDARWLDAAARLAARARPLSRPNPAVGTIFVKDERVIARGWTQASGRPHAEAHALAQLPPGVAHGSTAYVTLEPCAHESSRGPACADLLAEARPARVVIGVVDPDPRTSGDGIARLQAAGIEVELLDTAASRTSLAGYLSQKRLGRPLVTLKIAISQDGFMARPAGQDQWITGAEARAHVHAHRARQDAILVGSGTWRADRPRLDVRLPGIEDRSPKRYVLTTDGVPEGAEAIGSPGEIAALASLQYLYVEGGAATAQAFLDADLVDRIHIYRAPITIGEGLRAPEAFFDLLERWEVTEHRQLGSDTFTAYSRVS